VRKDLHKGKFLCALKRCFMYFAGYVYIFRE